MGEHARDLFDEVTAVNDAPVPRDALPTNAIEPIVLVERVGVAVPVPLKTSVEQVGVAVPVPLKATVEVAPLAQAIPIEEAVGAGSAARPPRIVPWSSSPRWHFVSISVALACMIMTASVLAWARDEVEVARQAQAAQRRELLMTHEVAPPPAPPVAVAPAPVAVAPAPVPCSADTVTEDVPLRLEPTKRHHSSHSHDER